MNLIFSKFLERTISHFEALEACAPITFADELPPRPGVYLFLEGEIVERVGRSNHIKNRLKSHLQADHNSGAYAFKRARQTLGGKATYRKGTGRKDLQKDPAFMIEFRREIDRLRTLNIKYVVVEDPVEQYLLELYAAIEHKLPLDEFGNH